MALDTQQIEIIGRNWLTTELVTAGFEVALPLRDNGVDLLVSPSDYEWTLPVQVKAHRDRKMRIERKYLERNVAMVYVLLGEKTESLPVDASGIYMNRGSDYSPRCIWLTPEEAWAAPSTSGLEHDVDLHDNYYFSWATDTFTAVVAGKVATHRGLLPGVITGVQQRLTAQQSLALAATAGSGTP